MEVLKKSIDIAKYVGSAGEEAGSFISCIPGERFDIVSCNATEWGVHVEPKGVKRGVG